MAVNVNITNNDSIKVNIDPGQNNITVKIKEPKIMEFKLNARQALNGDIMIFDHKEIDIVILVEKKKVVTFAKDLMSDSVYGAESRLLEHLRKKGIVAYDSIQGGNIYGSLEAALLSGSDFDPLKLTLLNISEWMASERPHFEAIKQYDDLMDDYLTEPDREHSTELGEVPHEKEKGSIRQHNLFAPYLYGKYTY
jgi:hypothetical protein